MVRKHTRRAAKAAFAVSIGVALLIGITVFSGAAHGGVAGAQKTSASSKPTIVLGTKNFTEEYILGQLYGQALQAKGFKVEYKGSFGSSELAEHGDRERKDELLPGVHGDHRARPRRFEEVPAVGRSDVQGREVVRAEARPDAAQAHAVRRQRHLHDADEDGEQARSEEDLRPEEGEVVLVRRASRSARRGSPACSA